MLPGQTYSFADILQMARRRLWILVVPPITCLFGALVLSASLPSLYQSDMLIAIIPQRVPDEFVRSTVTLKTEERLAAIETQVTSRTLIEQMINEFNLYPRERERMPMEDVVELMRRAISVVPETPRRGPRGPEPLHAFHVGFRYPDPQIAAQVTQRLGLMFVDQNARDRGALALSTNQFLQNQLAQTKKRLEETERRLEDFRERYGNSLPTQLQANMTAVQTTQMQVQALVESIARDRDRKMTLERLYNDAVAELNTVATRPTQTGPAADPLSPAGGTPEQRLATARAALAAAELRLKPEHPDIIIAKRTIRELEEQVKAAASSDAPPPVVLTPEEQQRREHLRQQRAEIESLDRQMRFKESEERRLREVIAEYQRRIEAVPRIESQWIALTRDYDTQKLAYEELLKRSEESRVALDLENRQIGEQFQIVDSAVVPNRPISPVRYQINGLGLLVGLLIGFGLAAFLEFRDGSFRTERDVVGVLSLPVLAVVPYVPTAQEQSRRIRRRALAAVSITGVAGVAMYVFWTMQLWKFLV